MPVNNIEWGILTSLFFFRNLYLTNANARTHIRLCYLFFGNRNVLLYFYMITLLLAA
jgi:hypothetical protein